MQKTCLKILLLAFAIVAILASHVTFSQDITAKEKAIEKTVEAQAAVEPALVKFFNRPIIILRGSVFGHPPAERVKAVEERFSDLTKSGKSKTVDTQVTTEGTVITLDGELLMLLSNNDLDPFSKQSVEAVVMETVHRIENVLELIRKQKDPKTNLIGAGLSLVGLLVYVFIIFAIGRVQRWTKPRIDKLEKNLDSRLRELGFSTFSIDLHFFALIYRLLYWAVIIFCTYSLVTFILHQFPYTEPWGKKLGGYIIGIIGGLLSRFIESLPELFVAFIILMVTHWFAKISKLFFAKVTRGDIVISWIDPEAASPTSKIFTGMIWIFGIVMAYPYIPGSNTDAFKGIGVFLGLLISLGASSMVGQVIGGMVLMYSRAMKVGEFVQIDQNIGKVMEIGFFSTKLKTLKNEEINIPNSVLMGSITKNYSRLSKSDGLIVHTSVTIGYDAPWRQVHAMLINAAESTSGIKKTPEPFVLQKKMDDFYVEYEINAFMDKPETYARVKAELHANIQDEFNKYGVQIMSPNFEAQPEGKVWVPKEKWYESPAKK
ncbi:MAG: mechanosensitive ion channel domain-containing protein [Victivallales bacterium]|jgi:small-conductance mechanosensitive channel